MEKKEDLGVLAGGPTIGTEVEYDDLELTGGHQLVSEQRVRKS